jgi:hypothetical protein
MSQEQVTPKRRRANPVIGLFLGIIGSLLMTCAAVTKWASNNYGITDAPFGQGVATSGGVAPNGSITQPVNNVAFVNTLAPIASLWWFFAALALVLIAFAYFITSQRVRLSIAIVMDLVIGAVMAIVICDLLQSAVVPTQPFGVRSDPISSALLFFLFAAMAIAVVAIAAVSASTVRGNRAKKRAPAIPGQATAPRDANAPDPFVDLSKSGPAMSPSGSPFIFD